MVQDRRAVHADILAAIDAGIAETDRRERGGFDGLLGQLNGDAPEALRWIVSDLRDYLLRRYTKDEARALLDEYEPRPGYRNLTPVEPDIELAISLFNTIRSTMRCTGARLDALVFGARVARHRVRSSVGGRRSAASRKANSKRKAIIAAARAYRGAPTSKTANIAKKCDATPQYVRKVLKEEKGT